MPFLRLSILPLVASIFHDALVEENPTHSMSFGGIGDVSLANSQHELKVLALNFGRGGDWRRVSLAYRAYTWHVNEAYTLRARRVDRVGEVKVLGVETRPWAMGIALFMRPLNSQKLT